MPGGEILMKKIKKLSFGSCLLVVCCLMVLAGCWGRSGKTTFYMLESGLSTPHLELQHMPAVQLRRVDIPGYLDRNAIVTREAGGVRLSLAEFQQWAEPLAAGIQRVLAEVMAPKLQQRGVLLQMLDNSSQGVPQVFIEIARFDGMLGGECILEARWGLRKQDDTTIAAGSFADREAAGNSYESLVQAQSRLVVRFGESLAPRLAAAFGR